MGRSRGGLTSKIHTLVDTNGLPVRLALTGGEAHDNRLAGKLLYRLKSGVDRWPSTKTQIPVYKKELRPVNLCGRSD
jgi:hypothetical protein